MTRQGRRAVRARLDTPRVVSHTLSCGAYMAVMTEDVKSTNSLMKPAGPTLDNSGGHGRISPFKNWLRLGLAPNASQWRGQPIEHTDDYSLAVIEFDDQGWYQDLRQRTAIEQFLSQKARQKEDLLIVVFVHGWKHNAAADDTSLQSFRGVLHDARLSEDHRRGRRILGVYLSWRGLSSSGNELWMDASFWTRKKAATKVATGSIREILAQLRAFQTARNERNEIKEPDVGTRLILAGHSFGGLILFTAVAEYLIESVTGRTFFGDRERHIVRPFGDLVILINPAFEAARFLPVYTAVRAQARYPKYQRPCFLAVTGTNDYATKYWFPIGRWMSTRLERVRPIAWSQDDQDKPPADAEKKAILNTVGHLRWLITHRLSSVKMEGSAHQAYKGKGAYTLDWDQEREAFQAFNRKFRTDGHLQKNWKRTYTSGAVLEHVRGNPDNPFWIIQATPEVVDGHNGIFRPVFLDFLRQVCDDRLEPVAVN
jgi:pimeloyl-ACP methyl ester carboxylesterase